MCLNGELKGEADKENAQSVPENYGKESKTVGEEQIKINKAANALQRNELNELIRVLGFLNQLNVQLEEKYKEVLENIAVANWICSHSMVV